MKCSTNTISIILSFTLTLTGCSIAPKKPAPVVIVGSGTMYERWHDSILDKCTEKAAEIALQIVVQKSKEGMKFVEQDIINIHKYLTEKCSRNSGIVI
jgi:hypothetical protein